MRKFCLSCTLVLTLLACSTGSAQDFSNRGKEFWLAYSYHVGMVNSGGSPVMTLYITSAVNTSYTVEIYGLTTISSGNITAGQVVTVDIPAAYFINGEGVFNSRAIRVTAQKPVVVYSYITRNAASGATLCLPTAVLGREYVSMNYTQISNESNSSSFITIVAVEDNTNVEITPSGDTRNGWVGGNKYTISLNKGQIYQILGAAKTSNTGIDLTGSLIRSIPSATGGCKKIAVFSGSGKISIGCASPSSSDNLYQQLYPVATWGKKYLAVPSFGRPNAIYRVAKNNPATNVYVNGTLVPAASFIGNYYEFTSSAGTRIEADEPICVAQYFTTQGCGGNGAPYDPDMIILNPVEQNIDSVTLVSSNLVAPNSRQHHLHVIIKNAGTALQSFKLDGNSVPATQWTVHPADPAYSYAYFSNVAQGYHTISSDTGFNALAYGYADAETYGYSAGSNIKDQYQYISSTNQFATVNFAASACKGAPFSLSMTFPYQPTELTWQFNGLFPDVSLTNPAFTQTSVVNGKTLYTYALAGNYTLPTTGSFPIKIVAQNPTADGCSGVQEMDYDLQVYDPPKAEFNFNTNGCVTTPVSFVDNSVDNNNRAIIHRYWNFGDGNSQTNITNPSHTYANPGTHDVRYTVINDIGCKADTVLHQVVLNAPPVPDFTITSTSCAGKAVTFKDASTAGPSSAIAKWTWNFGDATPAVIANNNADQQHTFANVGTYNVSLQLETAAGCVSNLLTKPVTVNPNPVVDFSIPNICLPAGAGQFNSLSTISDGTQSQFAYVWNFGDATATVGGASPNHTYAAAGPFNISLDVTSNNGCVSSATKPINTIYPEPVANFTAPAEVCLGTAVNFSDISTAANSTISQWIWTFGNTTGSNAQNPSVTYAAPGTYQVTLSVTSAVGCQSVTKTKTLPVVVNALPVAGFNVSLPGCAGQDVVFNNTSASSSGNIVKWTWNYGDGGNTVLNNGNPFAHVYAATNTYPATLQVETDKGCVSTVTSHDVVINPVPTAAFTAPVICVNDVNAPFADQSTIASGNVTGWQWNFGDPNAVAGNPNTSGAQNSSHHYTVPGDYTAQFIATSNAGCKDTVEHTVTVNGAILTPSFAVQNTTALCSNKEINIKDASQIDAGKIVRLEIFWDANDLTVKTVDNDPQTGETYTHTYPEFGAPASRIYRVRYDVWSGINCVQSFTRDIELLATPNLAFDAALPVCSNAPAFQLGVQMLNINVLNGQGTFSGSGVSPSGIFNPAVSGSGSHSVVYTFNANNGCSNSVTKIVDIFPTPQADAGPDKVVLEGGKVMLTPKVINNIPVTYSWTPATWLSNPAIAGPDASPLNDITYTLTVTSDKGCTTSDKVFVELLRAPVIPNIFSPNGDGIHDRWEIDHLDSYPGCVVEIYNRYGQLVYRIVNYTTPWDGRINGKDAPIGTYYYIINPRNGRKPITGYVDIIR